MKNLSLLLAAIATAVAFDLHAAEMGTAFTYQGRLNDAGNPANGSYVFRFTVYNQATNGASVGAPIVTPPVNVSNGLFTVPLDFGGAVFTGADRWLGIEVRPNDNLSPFTPLLPLTDLRPAPYSLYAPNAGVASVANSISASTIIQGQSLQIGVGNSLAGSYATITGGGSNTVSGSYAAVVGGFGNTAISNSAAIGGGSRNIASGDHALVAGGEGNSAIGDHAFVGGGAYNIARGYDVVGGGQSNSVSADHSGIFSGQYNHISDATAINSFIGGGALNNISRPLGVIAGGGLNINQAFAGIIGGGYQNTLSDGADYGVLSGGRSGQVSGIYGVLGGGYHNSVSGNSSVISGGWSNNISAAATYAAIVGGRSNRVDHADSIAAGRGAVSRLPNSFTRGVSFSQPGDGQCAEYILTATSSGLNLNESLPGPPVPVGSAMAFTAFATAKAFGDYSAAFEIKGLIRNYGTIVAFVGTPVTTSWSDHLSINFTWDPAGSAANDRLQFLIRDPFGVNVRWVVRVQTSEVTY